MDTVKIGKFLKELRKEQNLTQEQLGEKVGVTNKTVSRWETGTYMPPIECLAILSELYGVSINEIVAGQRLSQAEFAEAAEENLSEALQMSEQVYRQTEKKLSLLLLISTVIAIVIILLMPKYEGRFLLNLLLIVLVAGLAFISNTVILAALLMNKERSGKEQK